MPDTPDTSETPAPLSRRDFLRRTGKEAAQKGVNFVPGVGLARAVLGTGDSKSAKDDASETGDAPANQQPRWLHRLLHWRAERTQPESGSASDGKAK